MSIKSDAMEYAKAKLNYGEGAGLLRRKIGAKLSEKLKDENYRIEFEKELEDIDMSKIQKSVDTDHTIKAVKDTVHTGIKFSGKVLAGLGITAATVLPFYLRHRKEINACVAQAGKKVKEKVSDSFTFIKGKIQNVALRFQKKREPMFYNENVVALKDYKDRIDPSSFNRT